MYVPPSAVRPEPYNLSNRNSYEKSVITKKLRIDKIRCNDFFFKKVIFLAYGEFLTEKEVFCKVKTVEDMKCW